MIVNYTVENFVKDNISLYERVNYYVENYQQIFVDRAKKMYPNVKKVGFKKVPKTDKDFYTDLVTDEVQLGSDQIEFLVNLNFTEEFCATMRHLINYSGLKYYKDRDGSMTFTEVQNKGFFESTIEISRDDLKHIRSAKNFVDKYFE